jgi:hypothetical protein
MPPVLQAAGAAGGRLRPPGTGTGGAAGACSARRGALRQCTPRSTAASSPALSAVDGPPAGSSPGGAGRPRGRWAAPPPRLTRPGARQTCSLPVAADGLRAPRGVSVVEDSTPSLSARAMARAVDPQDVCGAAYVLCTWSRECSALPSPAADLAREKGGKNSTNPLLEVVCLLTKGGLIRVRPGMTGADADALPSAPVHGLR